jgi:hypothetical protein
VPDERETQLAQTTGDNSPAINIAVVLQTLGRPWIIAAIVALALIGAATFRAIEKAREELRQQAGTVTEQLAAQATAQRRLERLVTDAAGGGAPAVRAIAAIRDLLRSANPDIDAIPAEQIPGLVRRILAELAKPTTPSSVDLPEAIRRAIADSQRLAGELRFADAAAGLDAQIAQRRAARQEDARADAALLAERGRIAGLSLRYRDQSINCLTRALWIAASTPPSLAPSSARSWNWRKETTHALSSISAANRPSSS